MGKKYLFYLELRASAQRKTNGIDICKTLRDYVINRFYSSRSETFPLKIKAFFLSYHKKVFHFI